MTLGEAQERFGYLLAHFILNVIEYGYQVRIREVQRTIEQQELYIAEGKSKTMNSKHLDSLAADIYFTKDGNILWSKEDVQEIGDHWESLDSRCKWGGNWKSFQDVPHFEFVR